MKRAMSILLTIAIGVLTYIVAMPYQYAMSSMQFYGIAGLLAGFSVYAGIRIRKHTKSPALLVLLALITLYNGYEAVHERTNFMIKKKIAAYMPSAPVKVVHRQLIDEQTAASYYQNGQEARHALSEEIGSQIVFVKQEIVPPRSVMQYSVVFKRHYSIDNLDLSYKACTAQLLCTYKYIGSVLIDPSTGELLGFQIYNKGVGK